MSVWRRVAVMLLTCDHWPYRHFQALYEYLLDRWELRAGSFRIGFVVATYGVTVLNMVAHSEGTLIEFAATALVTIVMAAMAWFFFIRDHLRDNWKQDNGFYMSLNLRALFARAHGWILRAFLLVAFVALHLLSTINLISDTVSMCFYLMWSYSIGVYVREPNKKRFEKKVETPAAAVPHGA